MRASSLSPSLAILAAGMGSRYGGLKQLDPVGPGGETILDYSVYDALRSGFERIVFIIRKDFEAAFRSNIGRRYESISDVAYAFQELKDLPKDFTTPAWREKPWGTGHAVWCAREKLPGPFAVINADDFYGQHAFQLLHQFLSEPNTTAGRGCMVGFRISNTLSPHGSVARGVCAVNQGDELIAITEHTAITRASDGMIWSTSSVPPTSLPAETTVSMNCWGLPAGTAAALEPLLVSFLQSSLNTPKSEFYLPAAIAALIAQDQLSVQVLPTRSSWFGVTYREDRPQVEAALRTLTECRIYPQSIWPTPPFATTP